ncbi:transmembrane protein 39A [Trichonephila clavipes]|nr:transmembrane protein 39A [Trichonephila clavipes]
MPGGRRNTKSNSFKHHTHAHSHASDDRHACDLPPQPQVVPPKHIPLPDLPPSSDLYFEIDAFALSIFAMAGQYINLYRSVFWLPYSHNEHALNFYLIDYYILTINVIMLSRRLPVCILKKICNFCFPTSYQSTYMLCIHIVTIISFVPVLLFCFYNVMLEHGILSIVFLIYPFVVSVVVLGTNTTKFLELKSAPPERTIVIKSKGGNTASIKNSSAVNHVCSMSAETVREEVEMLRSDFNNRWKQVLFNSFLVVYHATFLPCYFSPSTLHYDVHWVTQHGVFTGIGCFTLYVSHCFPPKYCDVLHRAALHLGRWQKVEIKNVHVPYSMNDMSSFKKYKCLTISEKQKVIESVEEGEGKVDVAKSFEIPLSSLSTILKNKEKIFSSSSSRGRKRVSTEQDLMFDDYVLVDMDIAVWGALSDAEIAALDHNNTESDEGDSEELTSVTLSEAKVSLNKLHNFFLQNHVDADILQASFVLEESIDKVRLNALKQKKITDFFDKKD